MEEELNYLSWQINNSDWLERNKPDGNVEALHSNPQGALLASLERTPGMRLRLIATVQDEEEEVELSFSGVSHPGEAQVAAKSMEQLDMARWVHEEASTREDFESVFLVEVGDSAFSWGEDSREWMSEQGSGTPPGGARRRRGCGGRGDASVQDGGFPERIEGRDAAELLRESRAACELHRARFGRFKRRGRIACSFFISPFFGYVWALA